MTALKHALPSKTPTVLRRLRQRRYPIWSIKSITLLAMLVIGLTAGSIYFFGQRSLLVETDWTLGVISVVLFSFLSIGLYRGVRVHAKDLPEAPFEGVSFQDAIDYAPDVSCADALDGDAEGCLGAILTLLAGIVLLVVLIVLGWLLLNIGAAIAVMLFLALSWIFYRALRQVFAKSRTCRGRIRPSVGYAMYYTVLYMSWLFGLAHVANYLVNRAAT